MIRETVLAFTTKVDFTKCQACHKRKAKYLDKRFKYNISFLCAKCSKF